MSRHGFRFGLVLTLVALAGALLPEAAEARHRRGRLVVRAPIVRVSPFLYWGSPYFGYHPFYAYGPHYPYYREAPGLNPAVARALDLGALDLDVKPRKADLYVDSKFLGKVRDFDGSPGFLWLEAGEHEVTIYRGGYATFEETVEVDAGVVRKLKLRMPAGESSPPAGSLGGRGS